MQLWSVERKWGGGGTGETLVSCSSSAILSSSGVPAEPDN